MNTLPILLLAYRLTGSSIHAQVCEDTCPSDCPSGNNSMFDQWFKYGSSGRHCYYWSTHSRTWDDADKFCEDNGGYLASVYSHALNSIMKDDTDTEVWIGASSEEKDGKRTWEWSDCEPFGAHIRWDLGDQEPNIKNGKACVLMNRVDGKWKDETCALAKKFVCSRKICEETESATTSLPSTPDNSPSSEPGPANSITPTVTHPGSTTASPDDEWSYLSWKGIPGKVIFGGVPAILITIAVAVVFLYAKCCKEAPVVEEEAPTQTFNWDYGIYTTDEEGNYTGDEQVITDSNPEYHSGPVVRF